MRACAADWFGDCDLYIGQIIPDHFLEISFHLIGHDEVMSLGVVGLAVVPDELDVIEHFLNRAVLSGLQPVVHFCQMHGVLHHEGIVMELEL